MTDSDITDGTSNTIDIEEEAGIGDTRGDMDTRGLVAAAVLGAALGAGLGLLATRLVDADDVRDTIATARRGMGRGVKRGVRAARRSATAAVAVKGYAERAREAFEDALAREVRDLRRAVRRRRRKFGF